MKKLALVVLLTAPFLSLATQKNQDLGIYINYKPGLFLRKVPDFHKMDLKNTRAVYLESDGKLGEWQALKQGRGKTVSLGPKGEVLAGGSVDVWFEWQHALDANHLVAAYEWQWVGGSSSQSIIVQVFELRDDKVFITQQIEAEAHGTGAGADINPQSNLLTVHALVFADTDGHCCPSSLSTVVFQWDGRLFRRIRARKGPEPKEDHSSIAARGTGLSPAHR